MIGLVWSALKRRKLCTLLLGSSLPVWGWIQAMRWRHLGGVTMGRGVGAKAPPPLWALGDRLGSGGGDHEERGSAMMLMALRGISQACPFRRCGPSGTMMSNGGDDRLDPLLCNVCVCLCVCVCVCAFGMQEGGGHASTAQGCTKGVLLHSPLCSGYQSNSSPPLLPHARQTMRCSGTSCQMARQQRHPVWECMQLVETTSPSDCRRHQWCLVLG